MQTVANSINGRAYWGKNTDSFATLEQLDLVHLQKVSCKKFLDEGVGELLKEISPVSDFTG